jgi:hypothetical protein
MNSQDSSGFIVEIVEISSKHCRSQLASCCRRVEHNSMKRKPEIYCPDINRRPFLFKGNNLKQSIRRIFWLMDTYYS